MTHEQPSPNGNGQDQPGELTSAPRGGPAALASRALRRAVGLDEDLLAQLEGDRRWYTGQVLLVSGVATMATVSMTTAVAMTTGNPAIGWPLVFGLALGLFVGVCDLTIVLPDGQTHRRSAWSYLGRIGFSIVIGGLAAMPLTAALFQRDVDHLAEQARHDDTGAAERGYQQQVTAARDAVHQAHAPAVQAATTARDDARRQADDARTAEATQRTECNSEINGTGSGIAGEGPRAGAKCGAATDLARRVDDTRRRAEDADTALAAAVRAELADADARVAALERPRVEPFQATELGVIDRISRTHDRLGTIGTLLITLALMAFDTLPVILKLAHGPTYYERILAHRQRTTAAHLLTNPSVGGLPAGSVELLDVADEPVLPLVDEEDLERFLRARLIIDPNIQAKDLYTAARDRGYDRAYPTFTRFLRTRSLRPPARADG